MVDQERLLSKIAELDSYLAEIKQIIPQSFEEYQGIEKKRSCERLLQLSVESTIDMCKLLVSGLRLGLPSEENDLFDKIQAKEVLSNEIISSLRELRAFRNILVHEYATIDDQLIYGKLKNRLDDFQKIREAMIQALNQKQ